MPLINIFFWIILLLGAICIFLIVAAQAQTEHKARQELMNCLNEQRRQRSRRPAARTKARPQFRFYVIDRSDLNSKPQTEAHNVCRPTAKQHKRDSNICA